MTTTENLNHTIKAIENASTWLVNSIDAMQRLSEHKYTKERNEITLQIGRLQVLADKIGKENQE